MKFIISKSQDEFSPKKVNLLKKWETFLLDRSIELDDDNNLWINGREVTISFVNISGSNTMPDGNYMLVNVAGDNTIESVPDDMCYITRFNDIVKPYERFDKGRYSFDKYMQLCSLFSCTEDKFDEYISSGHIEYDA